ncbi:MAG: hypothetical protein INR73_20350 [Williamsia sp.]|nr:hypothetical protein [Williamsia sp.]
MKDKNIHYKTGNQGYFLTEVRKQLTKGEKLNLANIETNMGKNDYDAATRDLEAKDKPLIDMIISDSVHDKEEVISGINKLLGKIRATTNRTTGEPEEESIHFPKHAFTFMDRSGFAAMYRSLGEESQTWFAQHNEELFRQAGFNLKELLFETPYYYKKKNKEDEIIETGYSKGPTLKGWLDSIVKKDASGKEYRDAISPPVEFLKGDDENNPDSDQSMGWFNELKDNLEIIELRDWGEAVPAKEWKSHSFHMALLYEIITGDLPMQDGASFEADDEVREYKELMTKYKSEIRNTATN